MVDADGHSDQFPANSAKLPLPRITLVTAVYNGEEFLEETIQSVIYQGYPNLEYIIVNDGSTDSTPQIIQKYQSHLAHSVNKPNGGLYDALNAGYARGTGEILGWLNASDKLHIGGLFVVGSVFAKFPEVEWVTGMPTGISTGGMTTNVGRIPRWSRYRFLAGANEHIQQESTFWRRSLWDRAGGQMNSSYRDVGDFDLWVRFFRSAKLFPVRGLIGGYRFHEDAISYAGRAAYDRRCNEIIERELSSVSFGAGLRIFRRFSKAMMNIPVVRRAWRATVIRALYRMPGRDLTPVIENTDQGWTMM